jgi:CDGSH-type Zn-finger protein
MKSVKKNNKQKIKILKNGPYLVTGNVPLSEKIITPKGRSYELKDGRKLPQSEEYELCRCGKSKNAPFCDYSHMHNGFNGTETAIKDKYIDRAELLEGPTVDLLDDQRCAFARFCHRKKGNVWDLVEDSDNKESRKEAIQGACECPTGRLTAVEKSGQKIELAQKPSIEIVQDPEKGVSAGIFVKGNIPIESSDGEVYEIRNREALCRCGKSENKPFCDATHVPSKFLDKTKKQQIAMIADSKSSKVTHRINAKAFELLEQHPEGIHWSELLSEIKASDNSFHPKTVNGSVWKLVEKFPDIVYKPSKGLFRLLKYKS